MALVFVSRNGLKSEFMGWKLDVKASCFVVCFFMSKKQSNTSTISLKHNKKKRHKINANQQKTIGM